MEGARGGEERQLCILVLFLRSTPDEEELPQVQFDPDELASSYAEQWNRLESLFIRQAASSPWAVAFLA